MVKLIFDIPEDMSKQLQMLVDKFALKRACIMRLALTRLIEKELPYGRDTPFPTKVKE